MKTKYLFFGPILIALAAGTAFAQVPTPAPRTNGNTASINQSHTGQWRVSKLIGLHVYNEKNEKVGEIDELFSDQTGKLQAAILGVGGFLEVGQRQVEVSFDKLKFVNEPIKSKTSKSTTSSIVAKNTMGASTIDRPDQTSNDQWYPDHAVLNATKDQVMAMPEFKFN